MVDVTTMVNQALLDAAEWAGVNVWVIMSGTVVALLILLILAFHWRRRESHITIHATRGKAGDEAIEFVEKTLVEFPADQIKIETTKGRVVIKLISPKPVTPEETHLPKVKKETLPSKVEEPEGEEPAPEEKPPESEPIPLGGVKSPPEEKKPKKSKKSKKTK